jgi:D-alanine--poly(phosphoribitol) ligase subunit 1
MRMAQRISCSAEALSIHRQINQTVAPYPDLTIAELFERQVLSRGNSPAVICGGELLSYRDINSLANGLARRLASLGIKPGHVVGVCLDRSIDLIVTLIAIAKCGAAYLPFDAAWPADATADVLCRSRSTHVVAGKGGSFPKSAGGCRLIEVDRRLLLPEGDNPQVERSATGIAYINFTSGTTGLSKGVQIGHRSIGRLVLNSRYARLGPGASVLHMSTTAFDATTFEIWGPLLTGGTCVLYPSRTVGIPGLRALLGTGDVNCVFLTTALFNVIVEEAPDVLEPVRSVLFGGEAYSARHVALAFTFYGPGRLVHMYGPTECTTFATYYVIDEMPTSTSPLPIGRPIQNTKVYVVRDGVLCGPGEIGQIMLAGPGVSLGYVGDGSATKRSFGDFDIAGDRHRVYITGDYGYLSDSGELIFEGRIDDQVKVNGFRIELPQVSRVMSEHPGVRQSYLTVSDGPAGEKVLIAFAVPRDPTIDSNEIRQYLVSRLPKYMVPVVVHLLESLPLLATGKVDRRALVNVHQQWSDGRGGTGIDV